MTAISFNIQNANATRLVNAFGHDWPETIDGVANSQSKAAFARERMIEYIKDFVRNYEISHQAITNIDIT